MLTTIAGLYFCKLPEINQGVTEEQEEEMKRNGLKGFLKYYHTIFGFVAEFFYVGESLELRKLYRPIEVAKNRIRVFLLLCRQLLHHFEACPCLDAQTPVFQC